MSTPATAPVHRTGSLTIGRCRGSTGSHLTPPACRAASASAAQPSGRFESPGSDADGSPSCAVSTLVCPVDPGERAVMARRGRRCVLNGDFSLAPTGTMARCTGYNRPNGPSSRLALGARQDQTVTGGTGVTEQQGPQRYAPARPAVQHPAITSPSRRQNKLLEPGGSTGAYHCAATPTRPPTQSPASADSGQAGHM